MKKNYEREYEQFLTDKQVALVGPAASIDGSGNGGRIDSCDIVVRLNYANIKEPLDSGLKTNIIYYDGSYHNYSQLNLDFLVCSYPETEWFFSQRCRPNVEFYENVFNHRVVPAALYGGIKEVLDPKGKIRPNTGLTTMVDLLQYNIKSLFVTGIDFYKTGYSIHPEYGSKTPQEIKNEFKKGDNGDYHDSEVQYKYFLQYIHNDKRVLTDQFLKNVITQEL
tara:strand:- start:15035 stop:15700 length:666 start_codon:yes stop_codon:yes gene_type:complete